MMFGSKNDAVIGGRMPMIAGNWKMNKTTTEAVTLSQQISFESDKAWDAVEVVLCPPFVDLKSVWNVLEFDNSTMKVGAQTVYWEPDGAYTGAISVSMLKEVGCAYCIVGHSERREYFGETDEMVNKQVKALVAQGIRPIACCGEKLDVREAGDTLGLISAQVKSAFDGVSAEDVAKAVVAYEPVWAIGTGRAATPEQAQEVCACIRGLIAELYGDDAAQGVRVLYGGSVNVGNAELFLSQPDIDGALVGGASLVAKDFASIVETALKVR